MESFRKIGLTKYESLIYSDLIKYGKSNAQKISERSKVPPTAVYPNLKNLLNKKLIQEIKGDVSLFEALPARTAIDLFVKEKQDELLKLKEDSIEYAKQLLNEKKPIEKKEVMLFTYGKPASVETYVKSFDKAQKTFYIVGWKFEEINDKYNLLKGFQKMIKRKIDVKIILTGSLNKNWELIQNYKEEGIKIKYLPLENFSIFVMDSEECKITLKNKNTHERFNLKILDKNLSKAINFYFLESWKIAKGLRYDKKSKKIIF